MTKKEAVVRVNKLKETIHKHRYLYHVLNQEEISPEALDSLKRELSELENQYPELVTPDSPTQRVAGESLPGFTKVRHEITQWSYNDAFTEEDIYDFDKRVKKMLGVSDLQYTVELKIDGLKIVLTYENSILKTAATRGDGEVGEDVTANIKTIESIPLRLEKAGADVVVEGEVWLGKKDFEILNKKRAKAGEVLYANPRNVAAGTVRQLDPKIVADRKLSCFIYDLAKSSFAEPDNQYDELKLLNKLGFVVEPHFILAKNIEEVIKFWKEWEKKKDNLPFGVDGVVVKVSKRDFQEKLGYTGKAPRFGVAIKFKAKEAVTVVEDITFQVGRTGVVTPVANLRPVLLDGSTVSRATLHNEDEIKRLDVRVGDTVVIQKAGDIIPDIIKVLPEMREKNSRPFVFPTELDICGGAIERIPGQAAHRCVSKNSIAQVRRRFYYFTSKQAFDIDGLGPKIIDALMDAGLVSDFSDIFTLEKGDLLSLPRFAEKSVDNLLEAIEKAREITLSRFIVSLSIDHVGEETAIDLAKHFKTWDKLAQASVEELEAIDGVGGVVAHSIVTWFKNKDHQKVVEKLLKQVEVETQLVGKLAPNKFSGQSFVFTGTLETLGRDEAKNLVRDSGGSVSSSVSVKTSFVVAGRDPGSKYTEAEKLGIKILSEAEFKKLLS
jgi:DNA ligase (NAD+)